MVVVGTFDWPKTIASGEFYCPSCSGAKKYRHRIFRPFLTVYFIPLIPIGGKQEYVECMSCRQRFHPAVLFADNSTDHKFFSDDLLQVLALTILEDGHVSDEEIARAIDVQRVIGQSQLTQDELIRACSRLRSKPITLAGYLWSCKSRWSRDEKISVVQAVFAVAAAEGEISRSRLVALMKTQEVLDLSTEEFHNCITEAERIQF